MMCLVRSGVHRGLLASRVAPFPLTGDRPMPQPRHARSFAGTPTGVTDLLHTHLTMGLRPAGECPACDQHRVGLAMAVRASDAPVITA